MLGLWWRERVGARNWLFAPCLRAALKAMRVPIIGFWTHCVMMAERPKCQGRFGHSGRRRSDEMDGRTQGRARQNAVNLAFWCGSQATLCRVHPPAMHRGARTTRPALDDQTRAQMQNRPPWWAAGVLCQSARGDDVSGILHFALRVKQRERSRHSGLISG